MSLATPPVKVKSLRLAHRRGGHLSLNGKNSRAGMIEPPDNLTAAQAETWRQIVAARPDLDFEPLAHVLAGYCKTASSAAVVDREIDAFDLSRLDTDDGLRRFKKLTDMRFELTASLMAMARLLRIRQHDRFGPRTRVKSQEPSRYSLRQEYF